ncbi:MAG: protein translocase subunit SecD [Thermodesulfobacteriota bacterium]
MKSIFWRILLLVGFTLLALLLFLPSTPVSERLPSFWNDNLSKIALGLDLQGGMHIVLEVQQDKAVETYVERLKDQVAGLMKDKRVPVTGVKRIGFDTLAVTYPTGSNIKVPQSIKEVMADTFSIFETPQQDGSTLKFKVIQDEKDRIKNWATSQALETIRNRIDKFGVTEPIIQRQADREIVIQLPGMKDPKRAINLIGKTAVLEFRLLDERSDMDMALKGIMPRGSEILYQKITNQETDETRDIPFLVKKTTLLTGDTISDARVAFDTRFNEPYVSIKFNRQGAKIFGKITGDNVGKRLAIILDGNVYSAPNISERIGGGNAQISGGFTHTEAVDLAIALRAGALPAPVKIIQNVTVGPTLGKDSIEAGIKAAIFGGILVFIFMIFFYKLSGIIAIFAVSLNLLMLMGAMAYFNATLTLPGIAGILLTIGMGVDANVLIFERIKEELRAGRTPRSAVDAGYDRAWWTIVDSQVTTLITAAVLFQFGSGPIKGFAVTLSLGIIINLFTALVGTKVSFDLINSRRMLKKLSI